MSTRDRDPAGRPLNSRPRDGAGRPLPYGAQGVERIPEDVVLTPEESLAEAQRLLDAGYPFHAHEVLEGAWKSADGPDRGMWKGLAQIAVGLTHLQRGNATGAARLLRRGADGLAERLGESPFGIDLAGIRAHTFALADRVERDGGDAVSPVDTIPKLRLS